MLFVANWKMNPANLKEAKRLFSQTKVQGKPYLKNKMQEVVICPPAIFLPRIGLPNSQVQLGVQNIGWEERGAFTGEISASMAADANARYCLIGHSERRTLFQETDELFNKKIKLCLEKNLTPIFCIGESLEEKQEGKTKETLTRQLKQGLAEVSAENIKKVIITYEPAWVISSAKNSQPEDPDSVLGIVILIKKIISQLYDQSTAKNIKVLYGGSVDSKNVKDYVKNSNVEGFLVGSASLNAQSFTAVLKNSLNF